MSDRPDEKTLEELRSRERERLFKLRDFPSERPAGEVGVLLSDRIRYYCRNYKLVDPFDEARLSPAAYALSVGRNFSVQGERGALDEGMALTIPPYAVAVIETYETINLPNFLIGRWNVQVTRAYEGLLWVGGAQVDPGFRGYLCCPIYNLSTEAIVLKFRDKLAVVDFVTTTPFRQGECLAFPWRTRKRIVFDDYPRLKSGIKDKVQDFHNTLLANQEVNKEELRKAEDKMSESLNNTNQRFDTLLPLMFGVVAVLFAGLGIVATTNSGERTFMNPPALVAAVALYFALRAHAETSPRPWYSRQWVAFWMCFAVATVGLVFGYLELQGTTTRASDAATRGLATEKQERERAIDQLRAELGTKIDALGEKSKAPAPPKKK